MIGELPVFVDTSTGRPFLLPLLFNIFLTKNGFVFRQRRNRYSKPYFEKSYLSKQTICCYISALHQFLEALQEYSSTCSNPRLRPSVDNLHLVDQRFVSAYLNEYLPPRFGSFRTLRLHQAALQSFFDWLAHFDFIDGLDATLRNDVHDHLGSSRKGKSAVVQYIPREFRNRLVHICRTERDRLILRCGYELGLRAAENLGLVLNSQIIHGTRKPGLKQVFDQALEDPNADAFEYWLHGKFCKGQKSRPILIPRRLLEAIRKYCSGERKKRLRSLNAVSDHLFVNYSRVSKTEISTQYPTDLFRSLRTKVPHLNERLSYHDLRHTFGTELYASLVGPEGSGRSEERALTIVQDRLGHADPKSTLIYVHLFEQMQLLEDPNLAT